MLTITGIPVFVAAGTGSVVYPVAFVIDGAPRVSVCMFITEDWDGENSGRILKDTGLLYTDEQGTTVFNIDPGIYWLNWYKLGEVVEGSQRIEVADVIQI